MNQQESSVPGLHQPHGAASHDGVVTVPFVASKTSTQRVRAPRLTLVIAAALVALWLGLASAQNASAHPLGNFTINHYSGLLFSADEVQLTYVLDFAEIPTVQLAGAVDPDGDGLVSDDEQSAYFESELTALLEGIVLDVDGKPVVWTVQSARAMLQPGQAGLNTLRIELELAASFEQSLAAREFAVVYRDTNYDERLGWREVVVQAHSGARIVRSNAPAIGLSDELRAYPSDLLSSPPDLRTAELTLAAGDAQSLPETQQAAPTETNRPPTSRLARYVSLDELTPPVIALSLLAAFTWGAAHALTPGHGKAVVAAYLVGTRGTARHAAFLAGTVTITHTAGVFALAVVTLSLSNLILPERLYPWLTVLSGALVLALGLTLLVNRLRSWRAPPATTQLDAAEHVRLHAAGQRHNHDGFAHQHAMPGADGAKVTPRSLLALGVSGGLVPCPSALVLLLGAIAAGQVAYGMALVLAFSVGLAGVLMGIGLIVVYARWIIRRFSFEPRVPRLLPPLSAAAISVAGLLLVADSLSQVRMI